MAHPCFILQQTSPNLRTWQLDRILWESRSTQDLLGPASELALHFHCILLVKVSDKALTDPGWGSSLHLLMEGALKSHFKRAEYKDGNNGAFFLQTINPKSIQEFSPDLLILRCM